MGSSYSRTSRLAAEAIGTFVLVLGGCGTAVLTARVVHPGTGVNMGVGFLGVALAFGLAVLTMAAAFGHVSGGHFNPAVTLGTALAGRTAWTDVAPYVLVQSAAATIAGAVLYVVASGREGFDAVASGFASNGYAERSPEGYSLGAVLLVEVVLTAVFLWVILAVTDPRAPKGFAPAAIGLALTLIHLVSIPVSNTSVNPARSLGVAWFAGPAAVGQLWAFLLAPLVGAALAGLSYRALLPGEGRPAAGPRRARHAR